MTERVKENKKVVGRISATKSKSVTEKLVEDPLIDAGLSEVRASVGKDASDMARMIVIQQCEEANLTIPKVLSGIVAGMDAKEQKVAFLQSEGKFKYSKQMISWPTRQKAIDQAIAILGIKAPERSDVGFIGAGTVILNVDFGDEGNET